MKWKRRKTREEKLRARIDWHPYFCWWPRTIGDHTHWLTIVERSADECSVRWHIESPKFNKVKYSFRERVKVTKPEPEEIAAAKARAKYAMFS